MLKIKFYFVGKRTIQSWKRSIKTIYLVSYPLFNFFFGICTGRVIPSYFNQEKKILAHMNFIFSQAFNYILKADCFMMYLFLKCSCHLSCIFFSFHNIEFSSSGTGASSYEGLYLRLLLILLSIAQTEKYCLRKSITLKNIFY